MDSRIKTAAQQLAEARVKGRAHLASFDLKHHDSLWGMKVFSWYNASANEAAELILQLDNPVIWIMSSELSYDYRDLSNSILGQVDVVLAFGGSNKALRQELEPKLGFYSRKETLAEALALLKSVANSGSTLLFAPGIERLNERWRDEFEAFLDTNK